MSTKKEDWGKVLKLCQKETAIIKKKNPKLTHTESVKKAWKTESVKKAHDAYNKKYSAKKPAAKKPAAKKPAAKKPAAKKPAAKKPAAKKK